MTNFVWIVRKADKRASVIALGIGYNIVSTMFHFEKNTNLVDAPIAKTSHLRAQSA